MLGPEGGCAASRTRRALRCRRRPRRSGRSTPSGRRPRRPRATGDTPSSSVSARYGRPSGGPSAASRSAPPSPVPNDAIAGSSAGPRTRTVAACAPVRVAASSARRWRSSVRSSVNPRSPRPAAACVLGPLDRVLEVDRDRLHVLRRAGRRPPRNDAGTARSTIRTAMIAASDDRHGDCRGYDRSHVPKPTTPLGAHCIRGCGWPLVHC